MSRSALASGDPLFRVADQFPLGRSLGLVEPRAESASAPQVRPFGLRFAVNPKPIMMDASWLHYDAERQVGVTRAGGKHSTGATSTKTSDGHKSMDSDTDHTED